MIKSIDRIITAKDISPDGTARGYYLDQCQKVKTGRGINLEILSMDNPVGYPVNARIYQGQWIADCSCLGASFVDPDFPVFFCFSCGNRENEGNARPVVFPKNRIEIETKILERPVNDVSGLTDIDRTALSKPLVFVGDKGLSRNWNPDETMDDLRKQQDDAIKKYKKAGK